VRIEAAVTPAVAAPFEVRTVEIEGPRADEVLVRIAGCGVCHTDLHVRDGRYPMPMPAVLGHEGSGVVEAVGAAVEHVAPGDHVVLTYRSCGDCSSCRSANPGYCREIFDLTYRGARADGTNALSAEGGLHGHFFGQSSFAAYAIANRQNTVKVRGDVPIRALGPLGCGVQTGVGAVFNSLRARPGTSIAVFGTGAVGLSAVIGAAIAGCSTIVAVDLQPRRLGLARELGATAAIRPEEGLLGEQLREVVPAGFDYTLDTTGLPDVVRTAADALAPMGVCGLIGGSRLGTEVSLDMNTVLFGGRTVRGIIGGDSVPSLMIPLLVDLYADGRLPLDRLISYYPLEAINEAVVDTQSGKAVKAILCPAAR